MTLLTLAGLFLATTAPLLQGDARIVDLKDGFVRVETSSYSVEVPKSWKVSEETRWGSRKAEPTNKAGELGMMTAPPSQQSWEQVYKTSLYFILREAPGKPSPYKVTTSKQGYEACTFHVKDDQGRATRRYVLLKSKSGRLLALSVRIPEQKAEAQWEKWFSRLVDTAKINE